MADIARVTGAVLSVDTRTGRRKDNSGDWSMTTCRVLVGQRGTIDVLLSDRLAGALSPREGEKVDYLVELSTFSNRVQTTAIDVFPNGTTANTPKP